MTLNEDELERLLKAHALQPAEGFAERLLERVRQEQWEDGVSVIESPILHNDALSQEGLPATAAGRGVLARRTSTGDRVDDVSLQRMVRWLAVSLGSAIGVMQTGSFLLGLWVATSAG